MKYCKVSKGICVLRCEQDCGLLLKAKPEVKYGPADVEGAKKYIAGLDPADMDKGLLHSIQSEGNVVNWPTDLFTALQIFAASGSKKDEGYKFNNDPGS